MSEGKEEEATFYAMFVVDDRVVEKEGYGGLLVLDAEVEEGKAQGGDGSGV